MAYIDPFQIRISKISVFKWLVFRRSPMHIKSCRAPKTLKIAENHPNIKKGKNELPQTLNDSLDISEIFDAAFN